MMDYSKVKALAILQGNVKDLELNGETVWSILKAGYVSLGDSIAAGHTINSDWERDYGEGSQYGKNG